MNQSLVLNKNFHLASWSSQNVSQILIKVGSRVLVVDLDLIGAQSVHPGHEPGQGGLPWSTDPYQQHMTLRLSEYSVNSQHMVEDFVKQH